MSVTAQIIEGNAIVQKTKTEILNLESPYVGQLAYETTRGIMLIYDGLFWRPHDKDPRRCLYFLDDFDGGPQDFLKWRLSISGAGSQVSNASLATVSASAPGWAYMETGTTNTGYTGMWRSQAASYDPGAGELMLHARIKPRNLSTVGEEYKFDVGFHDNTANTAPTDGSFFQYDRLTDGDFWSCVNYKAGSTTKTVTASVPSTTSPVLLSIWLTSTNARFYVDRVLKATISTNLPVSTNYLMPALRIIKSAGTTSRGIDLDFVEWWQIFDSPR
jgi:hypothetical protein